MNEVCMDMKVEIWSDFVSPLCYIAKHKFDLALKKFSQQQYVNVEFKSFLLHNEKNLRTKSWKELLIETCNVPPNQINNWIQQLYDQAQELNLSIDLNGFTLTNTIDAHRLVKFAATEGKDQEVIDSLFKYFFTLKDKSKNNINEKYTLVQIAEKCGLDDAEVEHLLSIKKFHRAVEIDIDDALEIGIDNVPFFIFNETYALVGNQPVDVFLEALETSWFEDEERLLRKRKKGPQGTTYCEGEDCGM